jgi:O-antigen/teichoic acid export membrane protein
VFVKNSIVYSSLNFVNQILMFVQSIILRWLLPPQLMGVWNYVGVIQSFASSFDLGTTTAVFRELPHMHGGQKAEEASRVVSTSFWTQVGQGLAISAIVIVYMLVYRSGDPYNYLFFVAAILLSLSAAKDILVTFFQSTNQYIPLSRLLLINGAVYFSLLPIGAYWGGVNGLMIAAIIANIIVLAVLYLGSQSRGVRIELRWESSIFRRHLSVGLPMRIVDYPFSISTMLDVLAVTRYGSIEALAIYSTAKAIAYSALEVPSRIGTVMITRINERAFTPEGRSAVAGDVRQFLLVEYLLLFPLLICAVYNALSTLVIVVIPKYSQAIPILQVLLLILYFVPQTSLVRNYWILDKRFVHLGVSNLVALAGMGLFIGIAVLIFKADPVYLAWAVVGGYVTQYVFIMYSVGSSLWGVRLASSTILIALASACYVVVVLRIFGIMPEMSGNRQYATFVYGATMSFVCMLPPIVLGVYLLSESHRSLVLNYIPYGQKCATLMKRMLPKSWK